MMEMMLSLPYLGLGLVVGFFAGLLGIGGGGIMVPVLTMLFIAQGFADTQHIHLALGTSLASIVVTSISSMRSHHQHGAVQWNIVKVMAPGILAGTFMLSYFAHFLSTTFLAILFSIFMSYVGFQMFLNLKPKPTRQLPGTVGISSVGFGIGGLSALVAIGGGSLIVPFLTWCNVKIQQAIGTSSAIGLPIALAGSIGYMLSGSGVGGLPAYTVGYVYMPAVFLISIVSIFSAPIGVRLAHTLPVGVLKKTFAVILLGLAFKMLQTVL